MILAALSFLPAALVAFAMLYAFVAFVPRLFGNGRSLWSFLLQWALGLAVVVPVSGVALFGPLWLYEVFFSRPTTKDSRFCFLLGGAALLATCLVAAFRSEAGKQYSSWDSRGSPNKSLERTRDG
jgi:hypothetical protein